MRGAVVNVSLISWLVYKTKTYKEMAAWYQNTEDRLSFKYHEMSELKRAAEERESYLLKEIKRLEEENIRLTNQTHEQQALIEQGVDKEVRSLFADIDLLAKRVERLGRNLYGYYGKCVACGYVGKEYPSSFSEEAARALIYLEMRPCPKCGSERIVIK